MLSARLQLRQSQSLALTPQLLQSIRLLQYSHAELDAFLEGEIERNPLLEREEIEAAPSAGGLIETPASAADAESADERPTAGDDAADGFEALETPSLRLAETRQRPAGEGSGSGLPIEDLAAGDASLSAHVLAEIADAFRDPIERAVAEVLAGHLDDAGYFRGDVAAIAAALGLLDAQILGILERVQAEIEPAGLFARTLGECLALQLHRLRRLDPVMRCVLDNLDLLARRDFAALRRLTGEDEAGLLDILAEIRRLDPKPGAGFAHEAPAAIVPDVIVEPAPDGTWRIELNPDALPRLLVNERYETSVAAAGLDKDGRAFLSDCQATANWLVRSLDQRARTILKVTAEIVRRQDDFLLRGITGLKPMTLMAVAEAIGMHESTVSRVTSNKYVATPRGTFEMKFFFTVAIAATGGGEAHSAESVKHRIRLLVDTETPGAVLSDDDIAERLKREGVDLARRTVAKYREALGIPSSVQRRREMNARRLAS
ncbi:RNA polymerase sigma-54 factor [Aureimonas endophytica]|uniref:RNA polymerase sigma-54 factor n=1 Tax=Aureimonas endophytica TaxID=2027858 RepID=A0A917EC88_9HYPH|nr:RNA polymerase factor sigma-54 [Aureimonas endophytica]GGE21673.1 RNA polymerase sigma-54 factor [Aureimonas endophytica]